MRVTRNALSISMLSNPEARSGFASTLYPDEVAVTFFIHVVNGGIGPLIPLLDHVAKKP
jgi:hypothetical protein